MLKHDVSEIKKLTTVQDLDKLIRDKVWLEKSKKDLDSQRMTVEQAFSALEKLPPWVFPEETSEVEAFDA